MHVWWQTQENMEPRLSFKKKDIAAFNLWNWKICGDDNYDFLTFFNAETNSLNVSIKSF